MKQILSLVCVFIFILSCAGSTQPTGNSSNSSDSTTTSSYTNTISDSYTPIVADESNTSEVTGVDSNTTNIFALLLKEMAPPLISSIASGISSLLQSSGDDTGGCSGQTTGSCGSVGDTGGCSGGTCGSTDSTITGGCSGGTCGSTTGDSSIGGTTDSGSSSESSSSSETTNN